MYEGTEGYNTPPGMNSNERIVQKGESVSHSEQENPLCTNDLLSLELYFKSRSTALKEMWHGCQKTKHLTYQNKPKNITTTPRGDKHSSI